MQIKIIVVGKTDSKEINQLIDAYNNRLKHYIKFEWFVIPDIKNSKNLSAPQIKDKEGQLILNQINTTDYVVLCDEKGKQYTSVEFSEWFQKKMLQSIKQIVLVIGGGYGFSDEVYAKANEKISLSKMTFSHQMVRLFLAEQIYRAFTILKGESYHHD